MYTALKILHLSFAGATIAGFILRGYWAISGSKLAEHRMTRIAPHIVDTLFLASGIALLAQSSFALLSSPWMLAKLTGLVMYIVLGTIALRHGRTHQVRLIAFIGALATFAYVVGVALSKSPTSWWALI